MRRIVSLWLPHFATERIRRASADAPAGPLATIRTMADRCLLVAVERGIERLLDDSEFAARCKANMAGVAEELSWDTVVQPLVEFCRREGTFAMEPGRRRKQALGRAAMYFALKKLCRSRRLHD